MKKDKDYKIEMHDTEIYQREADGSMKIVKEFPEDEAEDEKTSMAIIDRTLFILNGKTLFSYQVEKEKRWWQFWKKAK